MQKCELKTMIFVSTFNYSFAQLVSLLTRIPSLLGCGLLGDLLSLGDNFLNSSNHVERLLR